MKNEKKDDKAVDEGQLAETSVPTLERRAELTLRVEYMFAPYAENPLMQRLRTIALGLLVPPESPS